MTRARRLAVLTALGIVALALIGELAVRIAFGPSFYAARIAERLGGTSEVHVDAATTSLLGRSIRSTGLTIRTTDAGVLHAETVELTGLAWGALVTGAARPGHASIRGVSLSTGTYALEVGHLAADLADSLVVVSGVAFAPVEPDSVHLRPGRPNAYRIGADTIAVRGVNPGLDPIAARTLVVRGLDVDVYSDRGLAGPPEPKPLPNEQLATSPRRLRLDSLHVAGVVRYAERSPDASRAGHIAFERLRASAGAIDTREPARATHIELDTWINGAFPLHAALDWRLASETLHLRAEGGAGAFAATVLNSAFVDIAGIEITSGDVHRVGFAFDAADSLAEGMLEARYENLHVRMVEKSDPSDEKTIVSLVVNAKIEPSHMPPRDEARVGRVRHRRAATESIFTFLWFTLRSGIKSMVGA